jgi:putative aminotransferase
MTRDEALERISRPEIDEVSLKNEFEFVAYKLGLEVKELQNIFDQPNKTYNNYRSKRGLIGLGIKGSQFLGIEKRLFR